MIHLVNFVYSQFFFFEEIALTELCRIIDAVFVASNFPIWTSLSFRLLTILFSATLWLIPDADLVEKFEWWLVKVTKEQNTHVKRLFDVMGVAGSCMQGEAHCSTCERWEALWDSSRWFIWSPYVVCRNKKIRPFFPLFFDCCYSIQGYEETRPSYTLGHIAMLRQSCSGPFASLSELVCFTTLKIVETIAKHRFMEIKCWRVLLQFTIIWKFILGAGLFVNTGPKPQLADAQGMLATDQ